MKPGSMVDSQGWEVAVIDEVYVVDCICFYPVCFFVINY